MIFIDVAGEPISWNRPGIIVRKGKAVVYDTQKREKEQVKWQIRSQYREAPLSVPISLEVTFIFPIPKSVSKPIRASMLNGNYFHMIKPDTDNCLKFIMDCMNELVYVDDAQISFLSGRKTYGTMPGTSIRIQTLNVNQSRDKAVQEKNENENEGNSGDRGRGDLSRDSSEQEGLDDDRRKESCIIPFGDGQQDH